jgi:hypothetical protein
MTIDDHDDPTWVALVQRLRSLAEQHGADSETGWLVLLAADQIVSDNQHIERLAAR